MNLPDVNLWLALAFEVHSHHRAAKEWFESTREESCAFCRMTQQGFLRLATNPSAFGNEAISLERAWVCYDMLISDPRILFKEEPVGLERLWRIYSRRRSYSPKVWNDAYLAAFAKCGGLCLITFDRGFRQYSELSCTLL